jgi:hypothetical protein
LRVGVLDPLLDATADCRKYIDPSAAFFFGLIAVPFFDLNFSVCRRGRATTAPDDNGEDRCGGRLSRSEGDGPRAGALDEDDGLKEGALDEGDGSRAGALDEDDALKEEALCEE